MAVVVEASSSLLSLSPVDLRALDDGELKERISELARVRARVTALEAAAVGELDARRAYVDDGALSTKAWLAHQTGVGRTVAGSMVRLATRLRRMPAMAAALEAGEVTEGHARSLGRCLTPRTLGEFARDEEMLVEHARRLEADDFDRAVTHWLAVNDPDGCGPGTGRPSELRASRTLDGRVYVDGSLDVDDGAEFLAELEEIEQELWRSDQALAESDPLKSRSPAERNAAALVEMSRRSSTVRSARTPGAAARADDGADAAGPRPSRPQVIVVADVAALAGDPAGRAERDDGTLLPMSVLQRWACDCSIGRVVTAGASVPFDLGRVTYRPSPAQRRFVIARDGGCRVPGCKGKPRWCEVHHVVPFPDGPTDVANLILLCARHHKLVHRRVLEIVPAEGTWEFRRPDGTPLRQRPPPLAA